MGANPPTPQAPRPVFSPDGLWWWDGAQWRPALSPDGRWRWDGHAWIPAQPIPAPVARRGSGTAWIIAIAAFGGILVLVVLITLVVLFTMGNQIANVFSNVAAALTSTPSP